jgi:hypothetical protein
MTKRSAKTKSPGLIVIETEPRIDSRLMVDRFGIQNNSFIRMIGKHEAVIREFGQLPFETQVGARSQG